MRSISRDRIRRDRQRRGNQSRPQNVGLFPPVRLQDLAAGVACEVDCRLDSALCSPSWNGPTPSPIPEVLGRFGKLIETNTAP
jgi:hypothetical protein